MVSRSLTQSRRTSARCDDDGGFTILEVVMAIVVITIAMTAFAAFFVNSAKATDTQSQRQTATQVGTDAMEQARALSGVGAYSKRDKTTSDLLWAAGQDTTAAALFPGVAAYLGNVSEAYDTASTLAPTSGYSAPLPICLPGTTAVATCLSSGATVTLDNIRYTRNWFIGYCYASVTVNAGACAATNSSGLITYLQVVIDVTWTSTDCRNDLCSYITVSRISPTPDPTFDASQSAPKPRIHNPGDQVNDVGQTVSLPIGVSGGTAPLTWQTPTLPTGLTFSTSTGSPVISSSGSLTSASITDPVKITLKVTDAFGYTSTAAFTWGIYAKPTLTNPGNQTDTRTATGVTVPLAAQGGAPSLTYSASNLPAGMSVDATTGVISGVPSTAQTVTSTVTVTDGLNFSATKSFTWTILPTPTVNLATTYVTAEQSTPSVPITYTCANSPCVVALTGAVPGLGLSTRIDNSTDQSSSTSLTVSASSGTIYLNGLVGSAAVSGTAPTSTQTYSTKVTITDAESVAATDTATGTARVYPAVTTPGRKSFARGSTPDQLFTVYCNGSCSVSVSGAPTGVGLSTATSTSNNTTTTLSVNPGTPGNTTLHLTGKIPSGAPTGTPTVTLTVTNTISGTAYTISSVGVWTVS